ncbi:hypothetical protein C8A03DRAFT_15776 [Achaetomium macrosporum]|uniref:Glycosyl transferase n=1 Tax=Achaetomium macrosporum TaxID=79813 RepID=A0AAN7C962_9PEZI|nr:hypothetical protein C8A03DRAFT_15776 [Achaetomium macrosporum]
MLKATAAASIFLALLFFFLPYSARTGLSCPTPRVDLGRDQHQQHSNTDHDRNNGKNVIPNQVHFVYILPDSSSNNTTTRDFSFEFSHFLSIYAAWHHWRPRTIYLHTNVAANGPEVARARNGTVGKWNHYIFTLFGTSLAINTVPVPTHAANGKPLQNMEHKSDFVRVKAVHDMGGVYIDWDVHALRDIRPLRESGFRAIGGRQLGGQINSGTFMAQPRAKMVRLWMEQMHEAYNGGWTTHSNEVITRVGQRLGREPGEMLILEREAFAPGSWRDEDTDDLFRVHDDTPSNLPGNYTEGMALPAHDEDFETRWAHPERFRDWERDWSHTYMLHAFTPTRWKHEVDGFEHITPRYVLARQSNFARAVYPVAKILYDKGLIRVGDSHTGF